VLANKSQYLWKRDLAVIGPFLPKRYTPPFSGWMLRMHAASGRAGAVRCPRNLGWNSVHFRLALCGMINVAQRTTISKRPDLGGRKTLVL